MFLTLWLCAWRRRYWAFALGVLALVDLSAVLSLPHAPFWIAAIGTPDRGVYPFALVWIASNALFNWIAIDWLWNSWRIWRVHWRIRGWNMRRSCWELWRFAFSNSVTLVTVDVALCAALPLLIRQRWAAGDWTGLLQMAVLWFLGVTAMSWLSFLVSAIAGNPYAGYGASCLVLLISGYGFPYLLWSPGAQWMYGAHQLAAGSRYLYSFAYLILLNLVLFLGSLLCGHLLGDRAN